MWGHAHGGGREMELSTYQRRGARCAVVRGPTPSCARDPAMCQRSRGYHLEEGAAAPPWWHLLPIQCAVAHDPAPPWAKAPPLPLNRSGERGNWIEDRGSSGDVFTCSRAWGRVGLVGLVEAWSLFARGWMWRHLARRSGLAALCT
jgi:hypothetical protein